MRLWIVHVWKYIFSFHFRFRNATVFDYLFCWSWSSQHMLVSCYWITNRQIEFQKWSSYFVPYVICSTFCIHSYSISNYIFACVHSNSPCHKLPDWEKKIQTWIPVNVFRIDLWLQLKNPFTRLPFHLWLLHASSNAQQWAIKYKKESNTTKQKLKWKESVVVKHNIQLIFALNLFSVCIFSVQCSQIA